MMMMITVLVLVHLVMMFVVRVMKSDGAEDDDL